MAPPTYCHLCKAPSAPFYYRRPGFYSQLPAEERGVYLRACAACRDDAEARWRRKFGLDRAPRASAPPAETPAAAAPDLFSRGNS